MVQPDTASKELTKDDVQFTEWRTEKRVDPVTSEETWVVAVGYRVTTLEGETIAREAEVELKGARKTAAQTTETFLRAELLKREGIS